MADDDLKRALIDRVATVTHSERAVADMLAKWTLADLEAMVEVVNPEPDA